MQVRLENRWSPVGWVRRASSGIMAREVWDPLKGKSRKGSSNQENAPDSSMWSSQCGGTRQNKEPEEGRVALWVMSVMSKDE